MKTFWFAISAAILWGTVPVIEKLGLAKGINPMYAVVLRTIGSAAGAVVLLAFLSANKSNFANFTWGAMALLMLGGMLANVAGQALFYNALQDGDVSRVLPITGAYPMIAFILGVVLLGEPVTPQKLAGAGLVLGGIILLK